MIIIIIIIIITVAFSCKLICFSLGLTLNPKLSSSSLRNVNKTSRELQPWQHLPMLGNH